MASKLMSKKVSELRSADGSLEYMCEYICDRASDVSSLPKCCTGSTAMVIADGSVYMVNTSGVWTKFGG